MSHLMRIHALAAFLLVASTVHADELVRQNSSGDWLPAGARFRFASLHLRHPGQINNSALSPDGKLLATSSGRSVILWDLNTGRALRRFTTPEGGGWSTPGLTFSRDGALVGCVHGSESAHVWNVTTGTEILNTYGKMENNGARGQFSPDGKQFLLVGREGIHYWSLSNGEQARMVSAQRVNAITPDAKFYVRNTESVPTTFGDAETGKDLRTLDIAVANNGIENGLAFSPDSKWMALVNIDKTIELRDTSTWELKASFLLPKDALRGERPDGSRYPPYRVALSPDAKWLFLGLGREGILHRWDVTAKKELPPLKVHHDEIANIHCLGDGKTLITSARDGMIRRWNLVTGASIGEPEGYASRSHAAMSPDGKLVVAGDGRGRLDVWDAATGKLARNLRKEGSAVRKLAFAPSSTSFAVVQDDGSVSLWDVIQGATGKTLALPKSKDDRPRSVWVQAMQFGPDSRHLYVAHWYKPMRFELATGAMQTRGRSGDFALSADGTMLATAYPPQLMLWDEATGKMRLTIQIRGEADRVGYPLALAFSPDGRRVAIGLRNGDVVLVDTASGNETKRFLAIGVRKMMSRIDFLEGHTDHATALGFSPDGRWLVTGANDARVRLWEAATGKKLEEFDGHEMEVTDVAVTGDGRRVFSSAWDGQSYLWDLRPSNLIKAAPEALWEALHSEDARLAYRAIWSMVESPAACAKFVRSQMAPAQGIDPARLRKLIADLNSDDFRGRDAAQQELAKLADLAAAAIEESLKKPPTLEVKRRLEKLQNALQGDLSPTKLREVRAIQAMELANTPETIAVLRHWAGGAPGADLTRNAAAALTRIERHSKNPQR